MKKHFLRIVFIVSCSLVFSLNLKAQVDSVKAAKLQAQLIDTICTCIGQTDPATVKTADDIQALIMRCFMSNGMSIFMDYATASGIDFSNTDQMKEMGLKVGMGLMAKCPAFMKMTLNVASDSTQLKKLMNQSGGTETAPVEDSKSATPKKN